LTSYVYSDGSWSAEKAISGTGAWVEDANYDVPWGATLNKNTGDIYLIGVNAINSETGDLKGFKYSSSSASWDDGAVADPIENDALVAGGAVSLNPDNGNLYAIYFRQNNSTTRFNGQNMGLYVKLSTDGGATWNNAVKLNGFDHDLRSVRVNLANSERIYATWFFEDWNIMMGRTIEAFGSLNPTPTISSVSDLPDPINAGNELSFSVDWSDPYDQIKVKICKTNSLTSQNCDGGYWATSTAFTASDPETVSYTAEEGEAGAAKDYYAFVCDNEGSCSVSTAGSFTINGTPTISSVNDTPDPVTAGADITFPVDWNDANSGENIKVKICKVSGLTDQNCSGAGYWATSTAFTTDDPANLTYTSEEADLGTQNYYAYVCDDGGLCSSVTNGQFTVQTGVSPASEKSVKSYLKSGTIKNKGRMIIK